MCPPVDAVESLYQEDSPKSIVRLNAERDPAYRPYCMRCPGLVRMPLVSFMLWTCKCGAVHDERRPSELVNPAASPV